MRHQTRHAAVAVGERVYPQKAMVSGGDGDDRLGFSGISIHLRKTLQKTWQRAGTDRHMPSHLDIALSQFAWLHANTLFRIQIFDPKKILWEQLVKAPVNLADALFRDGTSAA